MKQRKEIYLVTTGEYDDYRVRGVYTTPELAKEAAKLFGSESSVETCSLDVLPKHPKGMCLWSVWLDDDRDIDQTTQRCDVVEGETILEPLPGSPGWIIRVWARDAAQAERRAKRKAKKMMVELNKQEGVNGEKSSGGCKDGE